ncbi:ABC transporter ATP-binding protein [Rossellomorea vietnamensis]|uniref:ABC transporter ATP-binding protein n=1 Tax=Rossellomorea vietnamensis TaxID=218284 RepID=A0A5D4NUS2_9BACI|nr:ABC transporter ATP-binding protein [Rossellomorea vietnamensis]TYS17680.1 ABC transporter ATP-binding protein [Rossellomorea vietnamensis]
MIQIRHLIKAYSVEKSDVNILDIPYLDIEQGEQAAVTGPSGSGKSTLLHIIGGVIQATSGKVIVNGTTISELPQAKQDFFRKNYVGYVFQDFHLIASLTAEENIRLVLDNMPKAKQKQLISSWFERVGLKGKEHRYPSQLSRGQLQRVAIIRALINEPLIVLADEPTGSLDYDTAHQIMNLLLKLCQELSQTLLCVTHDRELASWFPKNLTMPELNQSLQRGGKTA